MGYSSWSPSDWGSYSTTTKAKPASAIFTKTTVTNDMNPYGVAYRECRDSDANPETTPIIIGLDVTGSMGDISYYMAKDGLGTMVQELLARKPVTDPQVLFMGFQDAAFNGDRSFQLGQFEGDITMTKWLESMVHGGGGGNDIESYDIPYYFGAYHTKSDCVEKRNKRGYIFTIGDEMAPPTVKASHLKAILGDDVQGDMSFADLITVVKQTYIPYHIVVAQGSFASGNLARVTESWNKVLGQNVLILKDYTKIAELIVSTIEVENGADLGTTIASWGGSTSVALSGAMSSLAVAKAGGTGVARL